jgi:hypothetical protein
MNQENTTPEKSLEKLKSRKLILLVVLIVVLIGVLIFQPFSGGSSSNERAATGPSTSTSAKPSPTPRANRKADQIVSQPLDLASLINRTPSSGSTGRNIFIYPTPTPPPPPKPPSPTPTPVPPPITLYTVNPASVVARTADFTMTVYGTKIPQDAKVYLNGRDFPATFVSEREIKARVTADAIRSAGSQGIQVRSASDAKLFSNSISFNISEPPPPPYRYIGIIVEKKGPIAVLKSQGGDVEFYRVVRDQKFGTHWRVVNIDPQKIIVEDTRIKVTHSIDFTGEDSR